VTDRGPFAWPVYAGFFRILGFAPAAWHWSLMAHPCPHGGGLLAVCSSNMARLSKPHGLAGRHLRRLPTVYASASGGRVHAALDDVLGSHAFDPCNVGSDQAARYGTGLHGVALTLQIMHLALIEYFSGLELARPILLWLTLRDLEPRQRVRQAFQRAAPYLAVLLLYAVYRSSFAALFGHDRFNTLAILTGLLQSPVTGLVTIAQSALAGSPLHPFLPVASRVGSGDHRSLTSVHLSNPG